MTPHIFDNAAEAEAAARFASLDALCNFRTFRFLETAGIGPGWHCLEIGGGSGSAARWRSVSDLMRGARLCEPASAHRGAFRSARRSPTPI